MKERMRSVLIGICGAIIGLFVIITIYAFQSCVDNKTEIEPAVAIIVGDVPTTDMTETPQTTVEQTTAKTAEEFLFFQPPSLPLPEVDTSVKLFTDYRRYDIVGTPHYNLQQLAYTDEIGCRRYGEDYIVGMGSFYSTTVGDRFLVELDTGVSFTVILGDGKADVDCDSSHMYTPCFNYDGQAVGNLLEFIVDTDVLAHKVYAYGSLDCIPYFEGSVEKLTYIGNDENIRWT